MRVGGGRMEAEELLRLLGVYSGWVGQPLGKI